MTEESDKRRSEQEFWDRVFLMSYGLYVEDWKTVQSPEEFDPEGYASAAADRCVRVRRLRK